MKHLDLTRDINSLVRFITGVGPTGGGDAPEAYELGLQVTRGLSWEAVCDPFQPSFDLALTHLQEPGNRALVMIGDSFPHPPSYTTQSIWWRDELQALVDMGIKVRLILLPEETEYSRVVGIRRPVQRHGTHALLLRGDGGSVRRWLPITAGHVVHHGHVPGRVLPSGE